LAVHLHMRRRNRRARRLLAPRRDTFLWLLSSGEGRRSVACSARRKVGKGDVVRVYTASKAKHAQWWRALRAAGIDIVSTWIDWDGNLSGSIPTADAWARHWCRCIDEARDCDILLFVNGEAEQACGALVELGAALAAGKRVFLVSPHWWSFQHHPRVRCFETLADAVSALAAIAGERLRLVKARAPPGV